MKHDKYTHGGYPVAEAWTWNSETWKKLGSILYDLYSQDAKTKGNAFVDYYELKRHFIAEDFENYIDRLDEYRVENNFTPIRKMVEDAKQDVVKDYDKEVNLEIPKPFVIVKKEEKQPRIIKVEQMSLF